MQPVKLRTFFAWYDLWVGAYWDRKNRVLYICPLPMWVIEIKFKRNFHDPKLLRALADTCIKPGTQVE